jgi:hypothetical protein
LTSPKKASEFLKQSLLYCRLGGTVDIIRLAFKLWNRDGSGDFVDARALGALTQSSLAAVVSVTEARLVNPLTSTSLTSRLRVISALGRYNQRYSVEDKFI